MRIKMKISYHASIRMISIVELFTGALIKTYMKFKKPQNANERSLFLEAEHVDQEEPQLNLMVSAKLRNMIALGSAFSLKPDGMSTLMALRDRLRYTRLKFQRYLQTWWNFDSSPLSKIPNELKISSYPQSY
jgi:hypothetical protein